MWYKKINKLNLCFCKTENYKNYKKMELIKDRKIKTINFTDLLKKEKIILEINEIIDENILLNKYNTK